MGYRCIITAWGREPALPSPRPGSAGLGDGLERTSPLVTFQASYSLSLTFQGSAPSLVCPRQPDLLRIVPTTVVIWARGSQQLVSPGTEGTWKGQGTEIEGKATLYFSEERVGSDCRIG